jgi:circadian clock protein KaiC
VSIFAFDEGKGTVLARSRALGMPLEEELKLGRISLRTIDPAEVVPDELVHMVREEVDRAEHPTVILDSLNGYLQAMPEERFLAVQLHELLVYLSLKNVVTVLVMAQSGLVGQNVAAPVDVSYVADTVLLLRYFETEGRVRKAISVLKKRSGIHENTIRELVFTERGLDVGEPLTTFRGVLSGVPSFEGALEPAAAPN